MRFDPPGPTCGAVSAFGARATMLRSALDDTLVRLGREGDRLKLTLTPARPHVAAERTVANVHLSDTPSGGYPFLASELDVQLPPRAETTLWFHAPARPGPHHVVFQLADVFEGRTLPAE